LILKMIDNFKIGYNHTHLALFIAKRARNSNKIPIVAIFILFVIMPSSLMSIANFSLYEIANAQYNSFNNSNNRSSNNGVILPPLSLYSKDTGQLIEDLKPRYIQLMVSFSNSGLGTSSVTNDPNFSFTTAQWPSVSNGNIINIVFGNSSLLLQPSSVSVKLTNVLNPFQSIDFNSMQLGSNFTLPLFSNDGGQNRNFVVSNEIPSGYYLVDVSTTFNNFNTVYTGKVFIPDTTSLMTESQQPMIISKPTQGSDTLCSIGTIYMNGLCISFSSGSPIPFSIC